MFLLVLFDIFFWQSIYELVGRPFRNCVRSFSIEVLTILIPLVNVKNRITKKKKKIIIKLKGDKHC